MSAVFDGYGRVSRKGDREGDNYISPELQEKKDRQWAKDRGKSFGIFELDENVSGATEKRPGLETLIARVEARISAGIICPKIDRFGRNVESVLRNYKRVHDAGGVVVFVDDQLDPTTPNGKMLFGILLVLAEWQWNMAKAGWAVAQSNAVESRGIHISSIPPTGYARGEGGILVPDPLVAPQVTEMFKLVAGGMTRGDACDLLNAKYGNLYWTTKLLYRLLMNRAYLGEARHGEFCKANAHPALTDPGTFAAVQANKRVGKSSPTGAILNGLIRCSGCRRVMTISWMKPKEGEEKDWNVHAYYRCSGQSAVGKCTAPANIKAEFVEKVALDFFWNVAQDKNLVGSLDSKELEAAQVELEEAEAERKAYGSNASLVKLGDIYVEEMEHRVALENAAREVVAQLTADQAHPELGDVGTLRELWGKLENGERRELLAAVMGAVYVRKGRMCPEERTMVFAKGEEPESPRRGGPKKRFPVLPLIFD